MCYCDSEMAFVVCCEPFLLGVTQPATPVQLMRSRYAAFATGNVNYIEKTMKEQASKGFNRHETKAFCEHVQFTKLAVLHTDHSDTEGTVSFIAHFQNQGKADTIKEKSHFKKIKGQWYYVSGEPLRLPFMMSS